MLNVLPYRPARPLTAPCLSLVLALLLASWILADQALAETWEEAVMRLEKVERQEKINAASRDLFYAIGQFDRDRASLALALGADVNQCVAFADASRRKCVSRMLDYAVSLYVPMEDEDGGQKAMEMIRLLLARGALLVDDDVIRRKRNSMSLRKLFGKESLLRLFLEKGYDVTPDLLAAAAQFRNPEGYRSSYPMQMLLQQSSYSVNATFRAGDFGPEIERQIIRHVHGLDHLDRPLESTRSLEGITLLHLAAVTGNTEVASYLIRQGADLEARTSSGTSAIDIAWSLWIYTWNESVWGEDYSFELASFLDFIRLLVLHGVETKDIRRHYLDNRQLYENVFVANCQLSPMAGADGETITLGDFLERHFTRTSWKLSRYDVLDMKAPYMCTIVVNFEGVQTRDHARVRIPMVFMDNMLQIAGNRVKDARWPIVRNGERLRTSQILQFWKNLGLEVEYEDDREGDLQED